jgi:hypothetical protein
MLRRFTDSRGDIWEIVRGRESYGAMVVLFCHVSDGRVFKSYLDSDSALDADREIEAMSDEALCARLEDADPGP